MSAYDGCVGVKTGYTKRSGRSLVSAAVRDGVMLIAVTIDAPDDWRDHKNMLDFGYSELNIGKINVFSDATNVGGVNLVAEGAAKNKTF